MGQSAWPAALSSGRGAWPVSMSWRRAAAAGLPLSKRAAGPQIISAAVQEHNHSSPCTIAAERRTCCWPGADGHTLMLRARVFASAAVLTDHQNVTKVHSCTAVGAQQLRTCQVAAHAHKGGGRLVAVYAPDQLRLSARLGGAVLLWRMQHLHVQGLGQRQCDLCLGDSRHAASSQGCVLSCTRVLPWQETSQLQAGARPAGAWAGPA